MIQIQKNNNSFDLDESLTIYTHSIKKAMIDLIGAKLEGPGKIQNNCHFEEADQIYFSVLFTGRIYGEFLISLNRKMALEFLGIEYDDSNILSQYQNNRDEILDTFKEILNIGTGQALAHLKLNFPEISITPPRALGGDLSYPEMNIKKSQLEHSSGKLSCYIYIDFMRLDVANVLDRDQNALVQEKQKQEELKRLNKTKSEFLANMSHELRTPLNGMIGMLDLLKGTKLTPIQQEQISIIYRSGEFLLSIISDILEFSRIESGHLHIDKRAFTLRDELQSVAESLASSVYNKNLEFNVFIDPKIQGSFICDDTRLKQVLTNIIGNAIKFTPSGFISYSADLEPLDNNENFKKHANNSEVFNLVLKIKDSGVGIPKDKIPIIFDSFAQADLSDNRKYGGSGLGLSISQSIVKAMHGKIEVESIEAQGTCFTIQIPLEKQIQVITKNQEKPKEPFFEIHSYNKELINTLGHYLNQSCTELVQKNFPNEKLIFMDFGYLKKINPNECQKLIDEAKKHSQCFFLFRPNEMREALELLNFFGFSSSQMISLPLNETKLKDRLSTQPINELKAEDKTGSKDAPITESKNFNSLKVLVVEDNQINQKVVQSLMQNLGYQVDLANNGEEALQVLMLKSFDLILMDCQMPVMNGYETTREIRMLEKNNSHELFANKESSSSHIPIIALTANAFKETKEKCFECGMDEFVTKPIKLSDLKEIIEGTLVRLKKVS